MRAKTHEADSVAMRVKPYKKEVSFNVAFHMTCVVTGKWMRTVLFRNRLFLTKQFQNIEEFFELARIVTKSLVILLILGCGFEILHSPIDFSIASIDDMSSGASLSSTPLSASFIAAKVTALGS